MSGRLARGLAGLAALALVGPTFAKPPPDPMAFWRVFFARPAVAPAPPGDSVTPEKVALGKRLFHDVRLSGHGDRSCASCHQPERAFTNGRPRALSLSGENLPRNVPALWDVGSSPALHWDGRAASLEGQARLPIENVREMAGSWPAIIARLRTDKALAADFARAYPESPTPSVETVTRALAAYERSLRSPTTRFDRWIEGDAAALDEREIAGFGLFVGKAGCVGCHAGWRLTDDGFHDIGLDGDDPGRGAVPGGIAGLRAFKTPSLRQARWTAPYMHDGSKPTFESVLEHYATGMTKRPGLSSRLVRPLRLSDEEKARLIAFLRALSSDRPPSER